MASWMFAIRAAGFETLNDDEANKRLLVPYRDPWKHPTPENV